MKSLTTNKSSAKDSNDQTDVSERLADCNGVENLSEKKASEVCGILEGQNINKKINFNIIDSLIKKCESGEPIILYDDFWDNLEDYFGNEKYIFGQLNDIEKEFEYIKKFFYIYELTDFRYDIMTGFWDHYFMYEKNKEKISDLFINKLKVHTLTNISEIIIILEILNFGIDYISELGYDTEFIVGIKNHIFRINNGNAIINFYQKFSKEQINNKNYDNYLLRNMIFGHNDGFEEIPESIVRSVNKGKTFNNAMYDFNKELEDENGQYLEQPFYQGNKYTKIFALFSI